MSSHSTDHTSSRALALIAIGCGAALMVGSVFADTIGISGGGEGFGWKQLIAAIVGLVVLLAGVAWLLRPMLDRAADHRYDGDPLADNR